MSERPEADEHGVEGGEGEGIKRHRAIRAQPRCVEAKIRLSLMIGEALGREIKAAASHGLHDAVMKESNCVVLAA
jgi:hypothetical protein